MIAEMLRRQGEALDPELAPYVHTVSMGAVSMPALRHPLVYLVPFIEPVEAFRANDLLKFKRERIEQARADGDASTFVFSHERPYRAEALAEWCEAHPFPATEAGCSAYWGLVAEVWIDSENIGDCMPVWRWLWRGGVSSHHLSSAPHLGRVSAARMRVEHRQRLASGEQAYAELLAMPEELTVYHGQTEGDKLDWSWTTDHGTAAWFARRFSRGSPKVLTGKVMRSNVFAYLKGRGESEIVVPPRFVSLAPV